MQRDYFSQMQANQTGTPTEQEISVGPGQQAPAPDPNMGGLGPMPEDLQMGDEDFEAMGLPTGEDPAANKQRIIKLLEEAGILEGLNDEEMKEIMAQIDKMMEALEKGDVQAFQKNPITQMVGSLIGGAADVVGQEQGSIEPDPEEQPADMASMAGMTGGNL